MYRIIIEVQCHLQSDIINLMRTCCMYVSHRCLYEYLRAQCLIKNFGLMIYNEGVNGESSRADLESSSSVAFGFHTSLSTCMYMAY